MFVSSDDRDLVPADCFDPFPEPRTIPSGWDVTGLFPETRMDLVAEDPPDTDGESE
jgi:hypothetical protein